MKTRFPGYLALGVCVALAVTLAASAVAERSVETINAGWRFHKGDVENGQSPEVDDAAWEQVDLPHTWNARDSFDTRGADDGYDITFSYYRGPAWYRKTLAIPEGDRGRRVFLKFEAANQVADVWVNGRPAGRHIGGYTGFQFDVTPLITFGGENLVAVRVDNAYNYDIPPQSADYTMFGGIYRDVYLVKTAPAYLGHALVTPNDLNESEATLVFTIPVINVDKAPLNAVLEAVVFRPTGEEAARAFDAVHLEPGKAANRVLVAFLFENALWSPDTPNVYTARIRLIQNNAPTDEVTETFGLRWFTFDPDQGFSLNGKPLRLKGVNRHQDGAGLGWAVPNELHVEDMEMIRAMGANFVRLAHYPQDPSVLDACDRLGLFVWEEVPVVRSVGEEQFKENAKNMLLEMILEHYNHPSIIIWGLMNEVIRNQPPDRYHWSVELCQELHDLAHAIDPSRKTTQAQFKEDGTNIGDITDIRGWNRYFGWYEGKFEDFGPFMDEEKRLHPNRVNIISEYGAGSKRGYHVEKPVHADFSEEWALAFHKSYWKQISERPWIAGSAAWNMFDFASEEKGGNIHHVNQKGLVSYDRKPKDVFYFYQSVWTDTPMAYIVSHTWLERTGKAGETKPIEVLSNCDTVELFLNGTSLGAKSAPFTWDAAFAPGQNGLRAVAKKGDTTIEDAIEVAYTVTE